MNRRRLSLLVMFAFVAAACGQSVLLQAQAPNPAANRAALQKEAKQESTKGKTSLSKGGNTAVNVGTTGGGGSLAGGGTSGGSTSSGGATTSGGGASGLSKC